MRLQASLVDRRTIVSIMMAVLLISCTSSQFQNLSFESPFDVDLGCPNTEAGSGSLGTGSIDPEGIARALVSENELGETAEIVLAGEVWIAVDSADNGLAAVGEDGSYLVCVP